MASPRTKVRRALPVVRSLKEQATMVSSSLRARDKEISCKPGCDYCCYQVVWMTILEALYILRELDDSWLGEHREWMEDGMQQWFVEETTPAQWLQKQRPCPFLKKHKCSIYEIRPNECALYLVVSPPEDCKGDVARKSVAVAHIDYMDQLRRHNLRLAFEHNVSGVFPMPVAFLLAEAFMKNDGEDGVRAKLAEYNIPFEPEELADYLSWLGKNDEDRGPHPLESALSDVPKS